jgi:hypothetical protein
MHELALLGQTLN